MMQSIWGGGGLGAGGWGGLAGGAGAGAVGGSGEHSGEGGGAEQGGVTDVVGRGLLSPRVVYSACVGKRMLLGVGQGREGGVGEELECVVSGFVETLAG